jgi:S-adenosylmethionine hydrolase
VVELTERRYARPTVSRTFEGRDRFAPPPRGWPKGIELVALGRPAGATHRLDLPHSTLDGDRIAGQVLRVDRFGNLITNIDRKTFDRLGRCALEIQIGGRVVSKVVSAYTMRRPASCARSSAAPITSKSRPMARARRRASIWARRSGARRAPSVIAFAVSHD